MTKMFGKKTRLEGVEPLMELPGDAELAALETPTARRISWRTLAGWGVAAVVVLTAGPLILDKIDVKGNMTPVMVLNDPAGSTTRSGEAALGTIHAVSEPAGAGVLLDGRFVGVTPLRFQWGTGPVTMTLKKNGFQDLIAPVEVAMAKEVDFRVTLQPQTLPVTAAGQTRTPVAAAAPRVEPPPQRTTEVRDGELPVSDAPLQLANVIRNPPESKRTSTANKGGVKGAPKNPDAQKIVEEKSSDENLKTDEKTKPAGKNAKNRKPQLPTEADMASIVAPDVRETSKDPDLAPLLRSKDASTSDNLNFSYAIQLAAFVDRDSAIRQAALWRKRGYDAYVLELWGVKDPSKMWQSVRVGRFTDLPQARKALEALKRQENSKDFYVARSDAFTGPEVTTPTRSAKVIPMTGPGPETLKNTTPDDPSGKHATDKAADTKEESSLTAPAPSPTVTASGEPATTGWSDPTKAEGLSHQPAEMPVTAPLVAPTPRKQENNAETSKPAETKPVQAKATEKKPTEAKPTASKSQHTAGVDGKNERKWKENEAPAVKPENPTFRPDFDTGYPGTQPGGQPDPATKEVAASMAGGSEPDKDQWLNAKKVVALQPPATVITNTAKDAAPEAGRTAPRTAPEAKSQSDKRKNEVKNDAMPRRESARAASDQAAWVERIYQQSVEKKEAGDREGEEALLQQVIKSDPMHKAAVRRLARIMVESNRGDKALEMLRQAAGGRGDTSLADEDPNLAAFLAALYQRREEHWQAIDLYEALLKKYPNKGLWQMGIGISLEKVDENAEAMRAYKKALASGDLNMKLQNFVRKRIEKL
ncbi:MAG: PEGA domain-containing protein [Magnetococcus sp. YQC-9]